MFCSSVFRVLFLLGSLLVAGSQQAVSAEDRPNLLWFVVDDMSANFSCYGETLISTPHVDALAAGGMRFTRAFVTAPTGDRGDESPGVYDLEIADELAVIKAGTPRHETFSKNAEIYRQWMKEGK